MPGTEIMHILVGWFGTWCIRVLEVRNFVDTVTFINSKHQQCRLSRAYSIFIRDDIVMLTDCVGVHSAKYLYRQTNLGLICCLFVY